MTINGPAPIVSSFTVQQAQGAQAPSSTREAALPSPAAVEAPEGVDPALWQLLTPDEQSFFATKSVLGPLTYGPVQDVNVADVPRGQRIDVRA